MDKTDRDALLQFMRLTLNYMHPHIDEYPLKEIENIDLFEGDESDTLTELPDYAVNAYYMQKAIKTIEHNK